MITDENYRPRQFPAATSSYCAWGSKPDIAEFGSASAPNE
jgi:2,3-dihydroxy-p-cumate/2,3-dihydroxybenzoate 3,4-dioxygenase